MNYKGWRKSGCSRSLNRGTQVYLAKGTPTFTTETGGMGLKIIGVKRRDESQESLGEDFQC